MRASATNFRGYLGPYYNFFWPKFWDRGSTPSRSKRVEFQKCLPFWQKRTVFRFFRASSVTIIAMKNLKKKTFESSWNALLLKCHQISAKVNSLGYAGHQSWKKYTIFKQNCFSWITFFSNQVTAIILAPLRFSHPDGANDISLDPVRSTSKFALRASMGQGDPGDPGDLSGILHLEHKEYPNKTWLWRI